MDNSFFLAKLIGIFMLIVAATWLFRKKQFETAFKEVLFTGGVLALSGVVILLAGLAIAIGHPLWQFNWRGLITLIGYFAILQGVLRIAFPAYMQKIAKALLRHHYWAISVLGVLGICLVYAGFGGRF